MKLFTFLRELIPVMAITFVAFGSYVYAAETSQVTKYNKGTGCNGTVLKTGPFPVADGVCEHTAFTSIYGLPSNYSYSSMIANCSSTGFYYFYLDTSCTKLSYQSVSSCSSNFFDDYLTQCVETQQLLGTNSSNSSGNGSGNGTNTGTKTNAPSSTASTHFSNAVLFGLTASFFFFVSA